MSKKIKIIVYVVFVLNILYGGLFYYNYFLIKMEKNVDRDTKDEVVTLTKRDSLFFPYGYEINYSYGDTFYDKLNKINKKEDKGNIYLFINNGDDENLVIKLLMDIVNINNKYKNILTVNVYIVDENKISLYYENILLKNNMVVKHISEETLEKNYNISKYWLDFMIIVDKHNKIKYAARTCNYLILDYIIEKELIKKY